MKGYQIVEECYLRPYRDDGIQPYDQRIGILDFLRELKAGAEVLPRCSAYQVVGLDEALYLAGREGREVVAVDIRRVLQQSAQSLDRRIIEVQVVCKGKIKMGHGFWLEFRGEELRLDSIFGVPRNCSIREGIEFYETGFNLSS
jgi:hypothetical protein